MYCGHHVHMTRLEIRLCFLSVMTRIIDQLSCPGLVDYLIILY